MEILQTSWAWWRVQKSHVECNPRRDAVAFPLGSASHLALQCEMDRGSRCKELDLVDTTDILHLGSICGQRTVPFIVFPAAKKIDQVLPSRTIE
mmetsp:Transcript_6810/g.25437  ORF Transcript_6810/g.25437 Transcript_6810/m.25437 type:complete len:94 (+) Transcript_6810:922-1203(+)